MGGDRFIPIRNSKQMDVASFLLSKENESVDINNTAVSSVSYFDTSPPPTCIMHVCVKDANISFF